MASGESYDCQCLQNKWQTSSILTTESLFRCILNKYYYRRGRGWVHSCGQHFATLTCSVVPVMTCNPSYVDLMYIPWERKNFINGHSKTILYSHRRLMHERDVETTIWHTLHGFLPFEIIGQALGKEMTKKSVPAFLTSPSPGLILVSWTSSKQADWLIKGSEVVLTVWSQMLFKILDCNGKSKTMFTN